MTTANSVARFIVRFFQEAGDPVTNLKLQKLLYYVQGWHLAINKKPFFDDRFEAWVHGPVQPSVYGTYKQYKWSPIVEETAVPELSENEQAFIRSVLDVYGGDTGYSLEQRTHLESPWIDARGGIPPDQDSKAVIAQDSMRRFFESQLR